MAAFRLGLITVGLACWCLGSPVRAAGFDCAMARSPVEQAICGDASLSSIDEAMAAAYRGVAAAMAEPERTELVGSQKKWLGARGRTCGADPTCLGEMTAKRIRYLSARKTLADEARNDQSPLADTPEDWDQGLFVICSPEEGVFDIRLPLSPETSLEGLADADRRRLEFPGLNVASTECRTRDGHSITVKYRGSQYHQGQCGAVWQPDVSVWINERAVERRATFWASLCYSSSYQSITVQRDLVRICRTEADDQLTPRRACSERPLRDYLAAAPDPDFAPQVPVKERLVILEGKEDPFCAAIFERWLRNENDELEDLFEPNITWTRVPPPDKDAFFSYSWAELDLDGDGSNEGIVRYSYESHMNSGDRFIVAKDRQALVRKPEKSIWHLDRALTEAKVEHLMLFNDAPFPGDHYTINVLKKDRNGKRPLLMRYSFESMYRSYGTDIVPTRIISELDSSMSLKTRCKIGPNLQKGDRL